MAEIRINVLDPADAAGLDRCYAIYREAILKSEQRPEADFKALFERTDYRFVVARMDEQIVGVAVSWAPAQADFWLFEYAAVSPEVRGMQIGSHLLKASMAIIGLQRVALIEVDADMGSDEQARRLRFYQRLGARRLRGLDYILPLDAFGAPPPMVMLALTPPGVGGVSVMIVEDWLRRIYYEVYGKGLDDPRLAKMIDPLPDQIQLDPI
jgi:ribosomal protein S18 acetylase RimI-like enzyme